MDDVLFEATDGVAVITINRPSVKNAVNRRTAEGVADAIDRLEESAELRIGILTGAGGTFCAGMDLKAFLAGEIPKVEGRGFAGLTEALPSKPLIAAVEGYALAGGFELALACDLIVAARNARFGLPEAKRGLVARAGGLTRLPRQMAPRRALELLLTGDFIGAEEAYATGLINRIAEPGGALALALELARTIAANGPLAVAATLQVFRRQADWPSNELFARQAEFTDPVFDSVDAREGAAAFAERRAPRWRGC